MIIGGVLMAIGHFLMAIEAAFVFALLALLLGVGAFKGNIASQVGALYGPNDLRRAMAFQIFYIFINVSVIVAPLVSGTLGQKVGWHYGFGCAGVVMVLGLIIYLSGRRWLPPDDANESGRERRAAREAQQGRLAVRRLPGDPDPGDGDFAADQPGDLQRLPRLGRPAVQPAVHALTMPTQLADHARRALELLDAGGGRGLLEMVEPQAPRAGRDQQDDHRQPVHHRRRRCACSWPR